MRLLGRAVFLALLFYFLYRVFSSAAKLQSGAVGTSIRQKMCILNRNFLSPLLSLRKSLATTVDYPSVSACIERGLYDYYIQYAFNFKA